MESQTVKVSKDTLSIAIFNIRNLLKYPSNSIAEAHAKASADNLETYLTQEEGSFCLNCRTPYSEDSIGGGRCTSCGTMIT